MGNEPGFCEGKRVAAVRRSGRSNAKDAKAWGKIG